METKSKSRKREYRSDVATHTRSATLRLNERGDRSDRSGVEANVDCEDRIKNNRSSIKDLRAHRIFSHVPGKAVDSDVHVEKHVGLSQIDGESECGQATPPDEVFKATTVVSPEKTNISQQPSRRRNPSPGYKTLKPCSRTKLSFSYRRLLPYLMDITKGSLKSIDMKPQRPEDADTNVPHNSSLRGHDVPDATSEVDLRNGQSNGLVDINDKLSISKVLKEEEVLGSKAECDDFATQHSPDENINELMDGVEDTILCGSLGSGDVHAVERDNVMQDVPLSISCGKNSTGVVQEIPLDDDGVCSGIAKCASILDDVFLDKRHSDQEELNFCVANTVFTSDAISSSSYADSPAETRCEQTTKSSSSLMCKQLDLSDAHEVKKNAVNNCKPESTFDSQNAAKIPSTEIKQSLQLRQLKRFKNYNSVSYRKLLPYLTDIYKESAGSSNKGQVRMIKEPLKESSFMKMNHSTSVVSTTVPSDSSSVTETDGVIDSKLPIDMQFLSHDQEQPIQCTSSSGGPNDTIVGECVEKSQCTASKEGKMTTNNQHLIYPGPNHKRPCASSPRGILKKNPRGCRGLCNCLKCASFRLHAENAFQFSRNQLLDSEEIALGLINELSLLRNLLKKSTHIDGLETSQVQEACKRVDAMEKNAKARLKEMNHDLLIHCQIPNLQRPTISFATHFEEINFLTAGHQSG